MYYFYTWKNEGNSKNTLTLYCMRLSFLLVTVSLPCWIFLITEVSAKLLLLLVVRIKRKTMVISLKEIEHLVLSQHTQTHTETHTHNNFFFKSKIRVSLWDNYKSSIFLKAPFNKLYMLPLFILKFLPLFFRFTHFSSLFLCLLFDGREILQLIS